MLVTAKKRASGPVFQAMASGHVDTHMNVNHPVAVVGLTSTSDVKHKGTAPRNPALGG